MPSSSANLLNAQPMISIARYCSVLLTTVQHIITKGARAYRSHHKALPNHLSYDEFKHGKGHMAIQYISAETGYILDVFYRRDCRTSNNHSIANCSLGDHKKVETVIIDMNVGYVNVIK